MRGANMLDVVVADSIFTLLNVEFSDAGLASDHHLVTAKLWLRPPAQPTIPVKFRRIANVDVDEFQSAIRRSSLYTTLALTTDEFACQLADVVMSELDAVAPVKTHYRRLLNKSTKWLSPEAIAAKRHHRLLTSIIFLEFFALFHSIFYMFLLLPRPLVTKFSGLQLQQFGILFH